jgi:glycosyltransferase involved in cell wall biosynthesis
MNQVRIHGDPFGEDAPASLLRSFLRLALGSGMRCSLSLAAVQPRTAASGQRFVPLTDGVRQLRVGTCLPPAEIDLLMRAADEVVAATAPVVVFAPPSARADAVAGVGLAWPRACSLLPARDAATAADLLERVRAELRWAGTENPPHALEERELAPWLALPAVVTGGPVVCVADSEFDGGLDLAIAAWRERLAPSGIRLRLVLPATARAAASALATSLAAEKTAIECIAADFAPEHVCDASVVLLPWRRAASTRVLVQALASGRPVCASRYPATAALLDRPGTCLPIGGRLLVDEPGRAAHFAPQPAALTAALQQVVADPAAAVAFGRRARAFVGEELVCGRPASPPPRVLSSRSQRPTVVLEAPLLETSSTAELTLATAQALVRRDRVDVRLVATSPFRQRLAALRARAPELVAKLYRDPGDVDLWLASGWPVRASRPPCQTFALRVDQEYGTLPIELTPHVTQVADVVVVHSEHVFRTLAAAGRPMDGVTLIPHGVDAMMHEHAPPDTEVMAWKAGRPAVLFCGGLIWRKGFDVFVQTVLAAKRAGCDFTVVVKAVGQDQHYGKFHLRELLDRFRATPGTPPLLLVERELSRAEMASLYTACDVLVHPYRGEGFCLPVLEARACGLPVIATGGGATDPFMVGPGAAKIPSLRRSLELPVPHVGLPWVLEPSPVDAGALLTETLRGLAAKRAEARAFAPSIRAAYTWDSAAASIEELAFTAAGKRRVRLPANEPVVTLPQLAPQEALRAVQVPEPVVS